MTEVALRRRVGLTGVVMFGAGVAIGVSIFSVLQPAAEVAGSGLLIAVALAAVPMVFFALVYAWLASAVPTTGASYEWPRRFLHPVVGFAIAWLRILSNVGALVILSRVLASYLGMVIDVPPIPIIVGVICLVYFLNFIGVQMAARLQTVLMVALIIVLALFVGFGAPHATMEAVGALTASGTPAILACVPLMITLFLGIESAVEIGEEVVDPRRTIPLGILLAISLTALVYASVAFVALALVGPEALARSSAPLLTAATVPFGSWAAPIIVGAATISILKSLNANALVFSRVIFAMARTGVLPASLATIHPRFGTPSSAVVLCFGLTLAGLLLPPNLVFLLLAVNIPTMLKYLACSLSAVRVAANPQLIEETPALGFSNRAIIVAGWIGAACAVLIIIAGWQADWRPYLLVAAWLALGLVYYCLKGRRAKWASAA